jgi:murein DD-endopeptidase MepM/ murein hydrolase activator NlpD
MQQFETVVKNIQNVKVIDSNIGYNDYVSIDLSTLNKDLKKFDTTNAVAFEIFIENYLTKSNSKVAYGGYNEIRTIYKRSAVFKNDLSAERNIHIGLDLWIKAGTTVLAALDGKVHSYQNNKSLGDYGPTIVLEHEVENVKFYTLYGHLSEDSLVDLYVGKSFTKAQKLATLGNFPTNGDYAPHLHFQIIKNIENYTGDYPGVCNKNHLEFYLNNCPNPNLLLKIK